MATKRTQARLSAYERRYRGVSRQLADIGYIASGSVASRYNECGKSTARVTTTPRSSHGPYWRWDGQDRRQNRQSAAR